MFPSLIFLASGSLVFYEYPGVLTQQCARIYRYFKKYFEICSTCCHIYNASFKTFCVSIFSYLKIWRITSYNENKLNPFQADFTLSDLRKGQGFGSLSVPCDSSITRKGHSLTIRNLAVWSKWICHVNVENPLGAASYGSHMDEGWAVPILKNPKPLF